MTVLRDHLSNFMTRHLHKHAVALVLLAICLYLSVTTTQFLQADNITNVLSQVSMIGIIAMGMTLLLVSGNFDLSVGGMVAFIGILSAQTMNAAGLVPGILVAIAVGLVLGTVNGLIVTRLRVNSLMATLGSGLAYSGLALLCSGSSPVGLDSRALQKIVAAKTLGIATPIIVFAAAIALSAWFLHRTVGGREVFAVGANVEAARYAGVRVDRVRFLPFVLTGGLCALASLILVGQLSSALPDAASTWPLQVIAAAVVGGVSIAGGRGSIFMAVVGVLLIGVVNNGFNLENLDTNYQSIFTGAIIVLAVAIEAQLSKRGAVATARREDGAKRPRGRQGETGEQAGRAAVPPAAAELR
jgi:ribose/xylose/arabinose/galactoside ABC-type transport system permease subunit